MLVVAKPGHWNVYVASVHGGRNGGGGDGGRGGGGEGAGGPGGGGEGGGGGGGGGGDGDGGGGRGGDGGGGFGGGELKMSPRHGVHSGADWQPVTPDGAEAPSSAARAMQKRTASGCVAGRVKK